MQNSNPAHVQMRLDRCLWCHEPLPDGRYTRKTHDACRMRVHRWKRNTKKLSGAAIECLKAIELRLEHEWSFSEGVDALKEIRAEFEAICARKNIVRVR